MVCKLDKVILSRAMLRLEPMPHKQQEGLNIESKIKQKKLLATGTSLKN